MALFAISDLHLAMSTDKPMDVFGPRWEKYMDRLEQNWLGCVGYDDTVLIPGDISWATYLDEAGEDLRFIERLPGRKIISRGNHDYWWASAKKMNEFICEQGITTINFMHNNSYIYESKTGSSEKTCGCRKAMICGTRGWKLPGDESFSHEDEKILKRELNRLELSLKECGKTTECGKTMESGKTTFDRIIVAMHYPPFDNKGKPSEFVDIMVDYGVSLCVYGHLHGEACKTAFQGNYNDIEYKLVSADFLEFTPCYLFP